MHVADCRGRGTVPATLAGLLVALGVAAGCAARVPPHPADQPAPPASDLNPQAPTPPKPSVAAPRTIEESSPALREALAELGRGETPDRLRTVAVEYYRLRVFDRAEAYLNQALKREPRSAESFELRARVYRDWGELDGALGDARRAIFFAPSSATAQNTLGTVLYVLHRNDEADRAFRAALALDPTAGWAASNLCYLALTEGDEGRAVTECERALSIDPALVPARHNLALTHAAAGRLDDARREFEGAGPAAQAHYNVGIIHLARREYERAVEAFDAALRESPKFDAAFVRAQEARRLAARR